MVSGMGAGPAAFGAQRLIDTGARGLVSFGTCGGLDGGLRAGDLVVASSVMDAAGSCYGADEAASRWVAERAGARTVRGLLVSAAGVVADCDAKRALRARSGACAVDMESAAVAAAAVRCGRPFIVVRAVVDDADTVLPRAVTASVRPNGDVAWMPFLRHLGFSPHAWGEIATLMRSAHKAERTLGRVARALAGS